MQREGSDIDTLVEFEKDKKSFNPKNAFAVGAPLV